jgi:hypothetical protein
VTEELFGLTIALRSGLRALITDECQPGSGVDPDGPGIEALTRASEALTDLATLLLHWEDDTYAP